MIRQVAGRLLGCLASERYWVSDQGKRGQGHLEDGGGAKHGFQGGLSPFGGRLGVCVYEGRCGVHGPGQMMNSSWDKQMI